eukprot:12608146-Alexandrium_andersonii.AAC.1
MSASLVGSEMCIRDSHRATTAGSAGQAPSPNTAYPNRVVHFLPSIWAHTVSYTHLTLPTICSV